MTYQIIIPKPVQKQLENLPRHIQQRIVNYLIRLKENPRPPGCIKMKGAENEYRVRVGEYRIRYEILEKDSIVLLLHCKHRKDVYRP